MKPAILILIATIAATTAAAQEAIPPAAADVTAGPGAASQPDQPGAAPPTQVSRSPSELISRTGHVARQQAESEIHYETRRRVQRFFDGLFDRR